MTNCQICPHRKDLNKIIPWRDPSRMFYDWRCFYNLSDSFETILQIYKKDEELKSIPDIRHDLYHHKWIPVDFICPLHKERICKSRVSEIIKNTNGKRKWLLNRIQELEKIPVKNDIEEHQLCSAYNTLLWIPFTNNNEINELCLKCKFNKYRNLDISSR